MAVPAILFIFSMRISVVRFFHLIRLAGGCRMRCLFKSDTAYTTTGRKYNDDFHCHRSGTAKKILLSAVPNCPSGEERTSNARPYNDGVFLNNAAVGAAIGRPPVKIRNDRKKSASAVKISAISPVGHRQ